MNLPIFPSTTLVEAGKVIPIECVKSDRNQGHFWSSLIQLRRSSLSLVMFLSNKKKFQVLFQRPVLFLTIMRPFQEIKKLLTIAKYLIKTNNLNSTSLYIFRNFIFKISYQYMVKKYFARFLVSYPCWLYTFF